MATMTLTVRQLIEQLQNAEDLDMPVYVYSVTGSDLFPVTLVDTDLTDRVDVNIGDRM